MKTTTELMKIASMGGNLIVDAKSKTTTELIKIAVMACSSEVTLTLKNANSKTTSELMKIASVGKNSDGKNIVTFDLSI